MPASQSREPGFESPMMLLRRLVIFVLSSTPQFTARARRSDFDDVKVAPYSV